MAHEGIGQLLETVRGEGPPHREAGQLVNLPSNVDCEILAVLGNYAEGIKPVL
jgi:hypothetical protein